MLKFPNESAKKAERELSEIFSSENFMADSVNPGKYEASLAALVTDAEINLNSLRAYVILMLTDFFRRDPSLREHFIESLVLARTEAETEKSDAKVLTIDMAISLLRKVPSTAILASSTKRRQGGRAANETKRTWK